MRAFKYALLVVVLGASLPLARADDIPWGLNPALNDEIFIGLGAFYAAKVNTTAQLNSQSLGVGTVVDFQNTLGMPDTAWGPDAEFRWRMSERWRLEVNYFWIGQTGSKTLDQDIQWGDVVYPANTPVNSKFGFSDLRTSVGYSFYKTSDKELGIGLGLHVLAWQASIGTPTQGTEGGNVLAPLPVISIYGGFALNEQWSVNARLDEFSSDLPAVPRWHHGPGTQCAVPALPARGFRGRLYRHVLELLGHSKRAGLVSRKAQPERARSVFLRDRKFLSGVSAVLSTLTQIQDARILRARPIALEALEGTGEPVAPEQLRIKLVLDRLRASACVSRA